ncbi:hypothetical protein CONPUDRAFT_86670 [Coniophora puteana RWD-64-598 SS2]|uniref:C2 domain-containing protein n=1 Tax=Coniophora puteana (strain RWD-64-598) TaxID=741705 RepID=A0A5M3N5L2_CONPW|nr:uncharacterized protein CONPUDRAFT_86670 [Coniophora puteana RWD-64-598 SS2]EIW86712.1 hypothetical protein CONPUDRAFT_86670 [Coniophora puteana RWD-64-598 SS2]
MTETVEPSDSKLTAEEFMVSVELFATRKLCGQYLLPSDGGLYRMWRQVELTVVQGRNLGTAKGVGIPEASSSVTTIVDPDSRGEGDANDYDVLCEICLNGTVYGRTTLKKGAGSPEWHEDFTFSDLPPFGTLEIAVLREKRLSLKSVLLGTIQVVLGNFRRHHLVEGWYPVLQSSNMPTRIQVGELRLKLRVDE